MPFTNTNRHCPLSIVQLLGLSNSFMIKSQSNDPSAAWAVTWMDSVPMDSSTMEPTCNGTLLQHQLWHQCRPSRAANCATPTRRYCAETHRVYNEPTSTPCVYVRAVAYSAPTSASMRNSKAITSASQKVMSLSRVFITGYLQICKMQLPTANPIIGRAICNYLPSAVPCTTECNKH